LGAGAALHLQCCVSVLGSTIWAGRLARCSFRQHASLSVTDVLFLSLSLGIVQGTYAKVKYGQHVETGDVVAIKVFFSAQC